MTKITHALFTESGAPPYMRLLVCLIFTLVIAGCTAQTSRFSTAQSVSDYLITKSSRELIRTLGEPRSKTKNDHSQLVWIYHSDMIQNKKASQGKCEMIVTFESDQAVKVEVNQTEYSPLAAPLETCNLMLGGLSN